VNCYLHTDTPAGAYCRTCGRALCVICQRPANGTVFCPDHVPAAAYTNPADPYASAASNPYTAPSYAAVAPVQTSPGLAFLLGLIPGVGAIYNGQYMKGLVHAVIFGFFMSFANAADHTAGEPILVLLVAAFYFYMPFEAYHTARKRQLGIPVDEWSSLISQSRFSGRTPVGPIALIVLGCLFLLDSLHLISFREIGRFWPLILIAAGAGMLYSRLGPGTAASGSQASGPPYSGPNPPDPRYSAEPNVDPLEPGRER
jgi:TM2 domain-containing membrane protein YozV